DNDDEDDGLEQSLDDLFHALGDGERGIEGDDVIETLREALFEFLHLRLDLIGNGEGVRSGSLVHADDYGRLLLIAADLLVDERAQLDASDVSEADKRAVGVLANDDVAEFFGTHETAGGADGIGELLAFRSRFSADLSGRIDCTLLLDRVVDIGDGHA